MKAAHWGHADVARLLLEAGADASRQNEDGKTALDLAEAHGHDDLAALLRDPPGHNL